MNLQKAFLLLFFMQFRVQSSEFEKVNLPPGINTRQFVKDLIIKGDIKRLGKCFECYICKKILCNRETLIYHIKLHTDERSFICPDCKKSYVQSHHLKSHRRDGCINIRMQQIKDIVLKEKETKKIDDDTYIASPPKIGRLPIDKQDMIDCD